MKKSIGFYIGIFIILELIKGYSINNYQEYYQGGRIEVQFKTGSLLTYNQLEELDGYKDLLPTPITIKKTEIEYRKTRAVLAIATDYNFYATEHLRMEQGSFLSKFAVQEGLDSVVISDLLANDLFGTTRAVGNIVEIEQKYYQVTGVYKKYPTILEGLLDDGQERIYIPFNSALSNQWQIENLIISSECLDGKTISVLDLDRINVTAMNSFINDQSDAMLKIRTARNMPLYILTIIIIVTLTKLGYREIKEVINQQKKIRIAGLKLLLYGVIIYLLYRIELCNIYIPPSALPNDNIFDIGFYLEYFKNQRIHYNYLLQNSISNYTRSYQYVLNTLNVFGIIQIACYGLGYKIIGVYLSNRKVFAKRGQEVQGEKTHFI